MNDLLVSAGPEATVYLIGAGGCGMSGLGHLLLDLGCRVAGSDVAVNEEILQLRARGAIIHEGHAANQVVLARPALVVYTSAVRLDNPELAVAQQMQVPIVRRAILLAALLHRQRGICVAGMHGKTTTSALLAFALQQLKRQPSYAIGARVPQLERHAGFSHAKPAAGTSQGDNGASVKTAPAPWFVIEADESDGTLHEFQPEHAIVLNVDEEHLDFYANFEAICEEFSRFAERTTGKLFYCADDPTLVALFAKRSNAVSFGYNPLATYRVELSPGAKGGDANNRFEIWRGNNRVGEFALHLIGEKNVSNAAAVIALLCEEGYAPEEIGLAIASFRGAARRQHELYRDNLYRVFDDYGHHPAEITTTLRALKELGCRRLVVAFQPHRFTRTQHLLARFATCFEEADELFLTEVYAASEPAIPGINGLTLAEAVRAEGQSVRYYASLTELREAVRASMQPGDLVLFLGAGDITRAAHTLAGELRCEMTKNTEDLWAQLGAKLSPQTVWRRDEPMARKTTLRVGGNADFYVEPASEAELTEVMKFCHGRSIPFMVLGRGSNLLVRDGGIRGVVICLSHPNFSRVEIAGDRLRCGAGARLKHVAVEARRHGLAGLEFLEGIPGSIGGALRMNAGAMQSATFEVVESVRYMDFEGNIYDRPAGEVPVEYRHCPLLDNHIALSAVLKGRPDRSEAIEQRMNEYSRKRWDSQPAAPSAGCIFKNPQGGSAGKLIDELGLKGTRVGGAVVSGVHANFIVNDGNATARDMMSLIAIIQERVRNARGIELRTEVQIVGED